MQAFLHSADANNQKIEINDYLLLGGDETCQWKISGASPRHAKIEMLHGKYLLKDLRSQTGTFLNDQQIQEAPLAEGDWIRIADQEYLFSFTDKKKFSAFPLKSRNPDWNQKLQRLGNASQTDFPVLLLGPSGTGKDVIAQAIHQSSTRSSGPFVSVNCGALSENLIESELFGHLKGSFTGAINDRKGAFESARGGTLFLDEVGDLPLALQAKLLRALENNEIRPVGSDKTIETNVRILAATHQNLIEKIQLNEFRSDLYFRLNVIKVETPTLFERMEDFEEILYSYAKKMKVRFSFPAIEKLKMHTWPGNIRELRNTVARACALFPSERIEESHVDQILEKLALGAHGKPTHQMPMQALPILKEMERQMILKKLEANEGNQRQTAIDLGIPKSTLHDRLRAYNIDPRSFGKKKKRIKASELPS